MTIRMIDSIDNQIPDYQTVIKDSSAIVRAKLESILKEIGEDEGAATAFKNFLTQVPELVNSANKGNEVTRGRWEIGDFVYHESGYLSIDLTVDDKDFIDAIRKGIMLTGHPFYKHVGYIPFKLVSDNITLVETTFHINLSSVSINGDGTAVMFYMNEDANVFD